MTTTEKAINELKKYTLGKKNTEKTEISVLVLNRVISALEQEPIFDKIKAEIERLHYHPKLDFVRNDDVVDMALDIIDKCRAEQGGE